MKNLNVRDFYLEGLIDKLSQQVEDIADFLNNPEFAGQNTHKNLCHELDKLRSVLSYAHSLEAIDKSAKLLTGPVEYCIENSDFTRLYGLSIQEGK